MFSWLHPFSPYEVTIMLSDDYFWPRLTIPHLLAHEAPGIKRFISSRHINQLRATTDGERRM